MARTRAPRPARAKPTTNNVQHRKGWIGPSYLGGCTILRRVVVRRGTFNLRTGEFNMQAVGTVEEKRCGVPLWRGCEVHWGVCRGCMSGWEVEESRFASEEERDRAIAAALGPIPPEDV